MNFDQMCAWLLVRCDDLDFTILQYLDVYLNDGR